jgi:DNA end-binding protein Ku
MARPFWSGQIQISLVSFGVKLFSATEAKSEIHFHQLSRETGERIHHQKVTASDSRDGDGDGDGDGAKIANDDIVKGYEYRKGEYVTIEPSEIENLRIPSRHTLAISQFVDQADLDPELYERPYFVVPDGENQTEAFTVIRKALQTTHKAALGKIAFGGREHLVAITAPSEAKDDSPASRGMMAYTLRYAEELRNPASYFAEIKKTAIDADQLSLARELIERKAAKFAPEKFHDEYEAALKEMVEAKVNNAPIPRDEPAPRSGKVINLMDALRRSVRSDSREPDESPTRKSRKTGAKSVGPKKGLTLLRPTHQKSKATQEKSKAAEEKPKAVKEKFKTTRSRKSA